MDAVPAGTPLYFGLTVVDGDDHGSVTIESAHPRDLNRPEDVEVSFLVCSVTTSDSVGGIGLTYESNIADTCSNLVPATGTTVDWDEDPFQIVVMRLIPTKAGQVITAKGAEISYRDGWQRGTQDVGSPLRISTLAR